ncbi:hypothetical protein [Pseudorhodobacter sp.]|uniref:hypothetical protein n=1 Tax=Pseudorhodobacter sp. TaxID=1934400 RepID=UPI0026482457|nr:hypothetical protein [Pseudorhodobacter sp.]MDN5788597.1 hypothetical protein [Pseudorhodobacter sp.]
MNTPLIAAVCATLALGACSSIGSSRLNPFNWFGSSEPAQASDVDLSRPADPRALVAQVIDMKIEQTVGGVIIRATGLPPTQAYWEAELVPRPVDDGKLVFDFRIFPPIFRANVSTPRSREVTVAAFLSDIKLQGIRQITVQGASNGRTSRR